MLQVINKMRVNFGEINMKKKDIENIRKARRILKGENWAGYNKAVDAVYTIINHYHNDGVLDEEHIQAFTKIVDEMDKLIKARKRLKGATFDEASNKANDIMMEKYSPDGTPMDWATIPKYREEYGKLVQSFM
jgi:hypothetical protein